MSETANAEQRAAWNGESGYRWVADAERRDRDDHAGPSGVHLGPAIWLVTATHPS